MAKAKLGGDFSPSQRLRTLFYVYALLGFVFFGITWYLPLALTAPAYVGLGAGIALAAVMAFILYWIPRYYSSMKYRLSSTEMMWHRGVWFRNTGIVPYNRITNIDITQGPVSRSLGIAALKIQTAGYSGQQRSAEIKIEGVENSEEMRDFIMDYVRGGKPMATESHYASKDSVLEELVKIRKLLAKK